MTLNAVLLTIGIIALVDSLFVFLFPKLTMKIGKSWFQSPKSLKRIGTIELIIALILLLIGMNV